MYSYNSGFTLIEVLVSLAVIATVTVALLAVFPRNALLRQSATNLTTAAYLAQEGIEETLSAAFYSSATGTVAAKARLAVSADSYLYNFWRQVDVTYVDEQLATTTEDTNLKKITASVFWYNPRQSVEQIYTLTTLAVSSNNN